MKSQRNLRPLANITRLAFLLVIFLELYLLSGTACPVGAHPIPEVTAIESSCISLDRPAVGSRYSCVRCAVAKALHDTLKDPDVCYLNSDTKLHATVNWSAMDNTNTNAVAQSNFSLLYHLLSTKHANADHRAKLNRISDNLAEYNISLVDLIQDCQLSIPGTNKTIQHALEDFYTESGDYNLMPPNDETPSCTTYFDCDVKRLACDLFRTIEDWYIYDCPPSTCPPTTSSSKE